MRGLLKILILTGVGFFGVQASEIILETPYKRVMHNPEKIESIRSFCADVPVVSTEFISPQLPTEYIEVLGEKYVLGRLYDVETHGMSVESLSAGEKKTICSKDKLLYTSGICDCIGISVWDSLSKNACLYHASKMELRDQVSLFQVFLDEIKGFSENSSGLEINLASCYWSIDLVQVIDLFRAQDLCISGLYVPSALVESSDKRNLFVDKETTPAAYFSSNTVPCLAMTLNTSTGKVGVHPSWQNN